MTAAALPPIFTKKFIIITVINFFIFFSFQMIFPTLPLYVRQLGGTDAVIGLVMGVFTVTSLTTRPFAGAALDKIGRKPVFVTGLLILVISAYSYGTVHSVGLIILIRLLHGLGWGIAGTASATVAAEIIPHRRFGEGMGYYSMANSLSLAMAPAAGLYIAHAYGFRDLFTLSALLAGLALLLAFSLRYRTYIPESKGEKVPLYESSAVGPAVMIFFISATFGAVSSFLPLYAYFRGIPHIGSFFTVYAAAILISRPLTGKLVDRYSYDYTIIPGLLAIISALFIVAFATKIETFWLTAFIYGLGFGTCQMSFQTMVVKNVARNRLGAANATFFSGLDLGMGLGALTLGTVAELVGYSRMYLFAGGAVILAFFIYVLYLRHTDSVVNQFGHS